MCIIAQKDRNRIKERRDTAGIACFSFARRAIEQEAPTSKSVRFKWREHVTNAKTVTISSSKTVSKTISRLGKKKKYYVRIRTYKTSGKTKYYSTWSKAKSVKTK